MAIVRIGSRLRKIMFCNEKLTDLYLYLPRAPLNHICKAVDLNYAYALKLLKIWEQTGLIVRNKAGYRYNIFYTSKGRRLADHLEKLRKYLKRTKIQWW